MKSLGNAWNQMTPEQRVRHADSFKFLEQRPPAVTELQTGFLDVATNQLTWEEHVDDKLVPDESEWHDVSFEFTATHPDWGMDDNVKEYFRKAQARKPVPKMEFPDDIDKGVNQYRLINAAARKDYEIANPKTSSEYNTHKAFQGKNAEKPDEFEIKYKNPMTIPAELKKIQ